MVAQTVKHLSEMQETRLRSLGRGDPLEKETAAHSGSLAWNILGLRSPVGYSPWGRIESDTTERPHFLSLSTILLLGIYPRELKAGTQTCTWTKVEFKKIHTCLYS